MKKLLYLTSFELNNFIKKVFFLSISMILAEIVMLFITVSNKEKQYLRFEDILKTAGYPIIFSIFLAVLLALLAFGFYGNFSGSKSIYTLMTLPNDRSNIYYSKFICSIVCILIYTTVQIMGIFLSYTLYNTFLPEVPKLNNALFLAFMRSDFLRIILPLDFLSLFVSSLCLISLAVAVNFAVICERRKSFVVMIMALIILTVMFILMFPLYKQSIGRTVFRSLVLIACVVRMSSYSCKSLKEAKIL